MTFNCDSKSSLEYEIAYVRIGSDICNVMACNTQTQESLLHRIEIGQINLRPRWRVDAVLFVLRVSHPLKKISLLQKLKNFFPSKLIIISQSSSSFPLWCPPSFLPHLFPTLPPISISHTWEWINSGHIFSWRFTTKEITWYQWCIGLYFTTGSLGMDGGGRPDL